MERRKMVEQNLCELSSLLLSWFTLIIPTRLTAIYAQGVGLGAAKAKEIGKFSEGYSGYVQQAQEAVSGTTEVPETHSWPYRSQPSFLTPLFMLGSRTFWQLKNCPLLHLCFGLQNLFLSCINWFSASAKSFIYNLVLDLFAQSSVSQGEESL